jgi:hypothetical protein
LEGGMTIKELIVAEIGGLDEHELAEFYNLIKKFSAKKKRAPSESLLSKLKQVKIDAPSDFAKNFDLYMSGEKRVP